MFRCDLAAITTHKTKKNKTTSRWFSGTACGHNLQLSNVETIQKQEKIELLYAHVDHMHHLHIADDFMGPDK